MEIKIDTKQDSPEEIRRAIRLLQNIIGDSSEAVTNQSPVSEAQTENLFNSVFSAPEEQAPSQTPAPAPVSEIKEESTEDLFAELFSEEEITSMKKADEVEEEFPQTKSRPIIEFY